jgi:hypothetical protein
MDLIGLLQVLGAPKIRADARRFRRSVSAKTSPPPAPRATGKSAVIALGQCLAGEGIAVPIHALATHGLIAGSTGAGKTWAATAIVQAFRRADSAPAIGAVDAKGDLHERLRRALADSKPHVLDFASDTVVPFALLQPRAGETPEQLVERRMEVFDDTIGRDNVTSLRMGRMLRSVLFLAVENKIPFPLIDVMLSNPEVCHEMGRRSSHERVRGYMAHDFDRERSTTLPALQARLDFLLRHDKVRLSFGAEHSSDLRGAMDDGIPVLVNTGGLGMSRSVSQIVQSLVTSDIRQAVFARQNRKRPYLWFLDEAQALLRRHADIENLASLLTMSRSFGTHIVLITQSLVATCPDRDFLNQLQTNIRWWLMLRTGADDARLLEPAMPVTGRMVRQHSLGRQSYMPTEQERRVLVEDVVNLPQREGYFWVRGVGRQAVRMRLPLVKLPDDAPSCTSDVGLDRSAVERHLEKHERRLRAMVHCAPAKGRPGAVPPDVLARLEEHFESRR